MLARLDSIYRNIQYSGFSEAGLQSKLARIYPGNRGSKHISIYLRHTELYYTLAYVKTPSQLLLINFIKYDQ